MPSTTTLLAPDGGSHFRRRAVVGVGALAAIWLVDASLDSALIQGRAFADELVRPYPGEIWMRLLLSAFLLLLFIVLEDRSRLRLLSAALAEAPDGVQITTLDGRIAYSNDAVYRLYGYTPAELRGRHVDVMNVDPTFGSRVVLPAIQRDGRWAGELDVRHKDGRQFPIWLSTALVLGARGRPVAAVGIIRDISERKRAEEALRSYAHRLEDAGRLHELFADILRHDLLGPAAALRVSIDTLLKQDLDPRSQRLGATARRSCAKLTEMLESAAKYAKVSALKEIEFGRVDLGAVLGDVIADTEPLAQVRQARIEFAGSGAYPARANPIVADVFANLISNAVKYGPERGVVAVGVADAGDGWQVSVADRGEGVPDGDKPRLFTRFERLGKEGVKGTGLGLAIAKRIVEMHGGAIAIDDNPGGGAVFRVTLPKA